ncbi:MAG: DUF6438 domain-containing protein [Bacteroidota bacterium]
MKLSSVLIFVSLLFFAACNTTKKIDKEETEETEPVVVLPENVYSFTEDTTEFVLLDEVEQEKAYIIASIERTGCYGKCPNYKAKVFSNGLVLYEGRAHVERQGIFEAYILQGQVDSLVAQADSINFFDLSAAYPIDGIEIYDLPNTNTFIRNEEYEKTITNNHNAPKILRAYEEYFEGILEQLEWKKVEEIEE